MKRYGIIFDCDGTLVDSLGQALESFNYALDKIGEPPRSVEAVKRHFGAAADRIFFKILGDKQKAHAAFEHYLNHQTELAKTVKLHTGIRELLDRLGRAQIPLAIVTGRHERDLEIILQPHQLASYFVTLVADSQLQNSKPAPDGILLAAKTMGMRPQNTVYVGDSATDIQAAHAAGSVAVAALWDVLAKRDELAAERPTFMAEHPSEVWTFFHKRFVQSAL